MVRTYIYVYVVLFCCKLYGAEITKCSSLSAPRSGRGLFRENCVIITDITDERTKLSVEVATLFSYLSYNDRIKVVRNGLHDVLEEEWGGA